MIEVAIGVIFVFLLLSLVVTALTEVIAQVLALRSRTLEDGIKNLLEDDAASERLMQHPLLRTLGRTTWADRLRRRQGKPSYVPKETFSRSLIDELQKAGGRVRGELANAQDALDQVRKGLEHLKVPALDVILDDIHTTYDNAEDRLRAFRLEVEQSFDSVMERAAGWYKRRANYIVFVVALVLTVVVNADAIALANRFATDDELRAAASDAAERYVEQQDAGNLDANVDAVQDQFDALDLPLSWSRDVVEYPQDHWWLIFPTWFWWLKAVGLLITAFALTLGAPFWFDALSKVVSLRPAGKKTTPGAQGAK
ncbi:MAG: hypothetical protein ACKVT1_05505 [Dehalococcoidia bacterium]